MKSVRKYFFHTLVLLAAQLIAFAVSDKYTGEELVALGKLKEAVNGELYQDYMKRNEFLYPWLKARSMDVEQATEMLKKNLKWRHENKIDSINDEESELKCDAYFPFESDGVDKKGRPVILMRMGDWDIRKQLLAGRQAQFIKCTHKITEVALSKARKLSEENENANKSTHHQFVFIADLKGYNLRQHACVACFPAYIASLIAYEANYPQSAAKLMVINAPAIFEALLAIARPVMSPTTRDSLQVFGFATGEWKQALLKFIPEDQLTPMYGGTKKKEAKVQ